MGCITCKSVDVDEREKMREKEKTGKDIGVEEDKEKEEENDYNLYAPLRLHVRKSSCFSHLLAGYIFMRLFQFLL